MSENIGNYLNEQSFDLPQLLNDDFFEAIRLLFNHRHFVSCAKLIVSFIDTAAFLEYGDTPGNYRRWLDTYVDLEPVGVTSEELWEYRNSLVHMTNLESRKVLSRKVKRLIPVVVGSRLPFKLADLPAEDENSKYLDLFKLLQALSQGAGEAWPQSFNADREKFKTFVERYELLLSDNHYGLVSISNADLAQWEEKSVTRQTLTKT